MQPSQWYYVLAHNRDQHGPVADERLSELISTGAVQPTDYVWKSGMENWARAETVPEIATRFAFAQSTVTPAHDMTLGFRSDQPSGLPLESGRLDGVEDLDLFAGFWRRAMALLIDGLLLVTAWTAAAGAFWLIERNRIGGETLSQQALVSTALGFPLGALLYYVILESTRFHATVGKLLVHLTVTRTDGTPPSFGQVLARNVLKVLSFATGLMGFTLAAFTERKQALHDVLSRTLVVRS